MSHQHGHDVRPRTVVDEVTRARDAYLAVLVVQAAERLVELGVAAVHVQTDSDVVEPVALHDTVDLEPFDDVLTDFGLACHDFLLM